MCVLARCKNSGKGGVVLALQVQDTVVNGGLQIRLLRVHHQGHIRCKSKKKQRCKHDERM